MDRLAVTNECALFLKLSGNLTVATLVLAGGLDADSDGLPNEWEQFYELDPLDPTGNQGTDGDLDGDEFTNLQEFVEGSDPNDPLSVPLASGDVNGTNGVTGGDSLLINQVIVGLRSYITTEILPGSHSNNETTAVVIFGVGFPTNVVPTVSIGAPVNLTLTNVVVLSRERITATVPPGGGLGTGTVNVISSSTNGVISFGRFINQ